MKVFKNKDGRWCFDVTCNGRRVRQIVGLSRPETEQVMLDTLARMKRDKFGIKQTRENIFFEEFADEFLCLYSKQNKRSWVRDRSAIKHFNQFFKGKFLSAITPETIEKYKAARKEAGANLATINRELACLKTLFNVGIKWGKADGNPVKGIQRFRVKEFRERILDDEETRRLVGVAKPKLKPILIIALSTGMRRNEILGLKWCNVQFGEKYIFIEDSKSGKSRRVPMNDLVIKTLGEMPRLSEFVFYNPRTKTSFKTPRGAFLSACDRAKIKNFRFHDLRHTAASAMVRNGVDLVTIMKILGHSTIQITMRYCHPAAEAMQHAVDGLGDILKGGHDRDQEQTEKQENSGKIPVKSGIEIPLKQSYLTN